MQTHSGLNFEDLQSPFGLAIARDVFFEADFLHQEARWHGLIYGLPCFESLGDSFAIGFGHV